MPSRRGQDDPEATALPSTLPPLFLGWYKGRVWDEREGTPRDLDQVWSDLKRKKPNWEWFGNDRGKEIGNGTETLKINGLKTGLNKLVGQKKMVGRFNRSEGDATNSHLIVEIFFPHASVFFLNSLPVT